MSLVGERPRRHRTVQMQAALPGDARVGASACGLQDDLRAHPQPVLGFLWPKAISFSRSRSAARKADRPIERSGAATCTGLPHA